MCMMSIHELLLTVFEGSIFDTQEPTSTARFHVFEAFQGICLILPSAGSP